MTKKEIIRKLKNRYRFIIYNDGTFAEVFSLRLSLFNTYVILAGSAILLIALGILLVTYTPIKHVLPNNEYQIKSRLYKNALLIDSLQHRLSVQENHYKRIHFILNGQDSLLKNPIDTIKPGNTTIKDTYGEINYVKSSADSLLRAAIEAEDRFNVTLGQASKKQQLFNLFLYPPVKNGVVIAAYQKSSVQHFGIDIAAQENTHVMATAEGTVISANWSVENGYCIIIQHEDNLISCYKQNDKILKNIGEHVERGEVIAILGNAKNNSWGPHLRFEIWHNGTALDPQDFISF